MASSAPRRHRAPASRSPLIPKPPVASTYGPPLGSTYLTSDIIPFHGIGEDADDGTLGGGSLRWFIRAAAAPCCGTAAGTGGSVDFEAADLAPGDYIVTLVAVDGDGQIGVAESLIHVIADTDHDGFSDADETGTCFGAGAATNGSTPSGDADGDGLPNASDPEPCVKATLYNVTLGFNPSSFDLTSTGTITISIQSSQIDLRRVVASSVRIVEASRRAGEHPDHEVVRVGVQRDRRSSTASRSASSCNRTASRPHRSRSS